MAVTPLKLEIALIAAAFAMALAALPVEEAVSDAVSEAPTTAPLSLKSPDTKAVELPSEVDAYAVCVENTAHYTSVGNI